MQQTKMYTRHPRPLFSIFFLSVALLVTTIMPYIGKINTRKKSQRDLDASNVSSRQPLIRK